MFDFDGLDVLDPVVEGDPPKDGATTAASTGDIASGAARSQPAAPAQSPPATEAAVSEPAYWKVVSVPAKAGLEVRSQEGREPAVWHLPLHSVVLEEERAGNDMLITEAEASDAAVPPRSGWVAIESENQKRMVCLGSSPPEAKWPRTPQSPPTTAPQQPLPAADPPLVSPAAPPPAEPALPEPAPLEPSPRDELPPQPPANARRALILFDWDDTLCPTTWIQACPQLRDALNGFRGPRRVGEVWDKLRDHARAVKQLMQTATSLGTVALVTLAERPWVAISIRDFMPEADSVSNLSVFYARENMVSSFAAGGCPLTAMKRKAMELATEQLKLDTGDVMWENLISIGDSEVERRAAHDVGRALQSRGALRWTKTVKLREHPDVAQLTWQVRALNERLAELVGHPGPKNLISKDLWTRPR
mmetsp:Transcript_50852/g.143154  ORF Transcript_50852/g.143154 Transcript_50852/m.143154 type:complete len:419 (-) Transcript_50852:70-1326(-)